MGSHNELIKEIKDVVLERMADKPRVTEKEKEVSQKISGMRLEKFNSCIEKINEFLIEAEGHAEVLNLDSQRSDWRAVMRRKLLGKAYTHHLVNYNINIYKGLDAVAEALNLLKSELKSREDI